MNILRKISCAAAATAFAAACDAQSMKPVGPSGWTARNWIGLAVQIAVFLLAVWGICVLAGKGEKRR